MKVCVVADVSLDVAKGDTTRVVALAESMARSGTVVELLVPCYDRVLPYYARHLREVGVHGLGMPTDPSMPSLARRKIALARAAKKAQADWVQVETLYDAGWYKACGLRRYSADVHGLLFAELAYSKGPFYWRNPPLAACLAERYGARNAIKVVAVSGSMGLFLKNWWGIQDERIIVSPNGHFPSEIESSRRASIKRTVAFAGSLTRWANVERIVQAARILKDASTAFTIIGDGPYRQNLERYCTTGRVNNVTFLGRLTPEDALARLAASEILIAPLPDTLALQVASPIKLVEYGALAKPIICDAVGDLAQRLVAEGGAIAPKNRTAEELAATILRLSGDEGLKSRVANRAREVCSALTWDDAAGQLAASYLRT